MKQFRVFWGTGLFCGGLGSVTCTWPWMWVSSQWQRSWESCSVWETALRWAAAAAFSSAACCSWRGAGRRGSAWFVWMTEMFVSGALSCFVPWSWAAGSAAPSAGSHKSSAADLCGAGASQPVAASPPPPVNSELQDLSPPVVRTTLYLLITTTVNLQPD